MDEFTAQIEALEHQFMRSWMNRDRNGMKSLATGDFVFLLGALTSAILDRPSWLEAATTRFQLCAYPFQGPVRPPSQEDGGLCSAHVGRSTHRHRKAGR